MAESSFSKFFQLIHSCLYVHDLTCMQICIASIELILIPTWSLIRYSTLNILSPSALDTICSYLPNLVGSQCSILVTFHPPSQCNTSFFAFQVHVFGPEIIEYFSYGATPDEICYQTGLPLFIWETYKDASLHNMKNTLLQVCVWMMKERAKFAIFSPFLIRWWSNYNYN